MKENNLMKYQILKKLKTKSKLIKLCDTLQEAHNEITKTHGVPFMELSYIGQFPTYCSSVKDQVFQIQGLHENLGIVLGINKEVLSSFNFQS